MRLWLISNDLGVGFRTPEAQGAVTCEKKKQLYPSKLIPWACGFYPSLYINTIPLNNPPLFSNPQRNMGDCWAGPKSLFVIRLNPQKCTPPPLNNRGGGDCWVGGNCWGELYCNYFDKPWNTQGITTPKPVVSFQQCLFFSSSSTHQASSLSTRVG